MSLSLEPMGELPLVDFVRSMGYDFGRKKNFIMVSALRIAYTSGRSVVFATMNDDGLFVEDGEILYGLENGGIGDIAVSHDTKYIAVAERSRNRKPNIYIYTLNGLNKVSTLVRGTEEGYVSVAFNKFNTEHLVSLGSSPDYMLSVWDWRSEKIMLKFKAFSQEVYNVDWSPTIPGHLTTCGQGHIRFWRMASTFTGLKLQGELGKFGQTELTDIVSFCELPDGKVISSSEYGKLLLWEGVFVKAELVNKAGKPCHEGAITVVMQDPSILDQIVSVGADGFIRWWSRDVIDLAEATDDAADSPLDCLREVKLPEGCLISSVVSKLDDPSIWFLQDVSNGNIWSFDSKLEGNETPDDSVANSATKFKIVMNKCAGAITGLASIKAAPGSIFMSNFDGSLILQDAAGGVSSEIHLSQWKQPITCMITSPTDQTGRSILLGFADGVIREVRCKDGRSIQLLSAYKPHSGAITKITVSDNGFFMATAGVDGSIFVFERAAMSDDARAIAAEAETQALSSGCELDISQILPPWIPVGFIRAPGVLPKLPQVATRDAEGSQEQDKDGNHDEKDNDNELADQEDDDALPVKLTLGKIAGVAFSPDGSTLAVAMEKGGVIAQYETPTLSTVGASTAESFLLSDLPCRIGKMSLPKRPADRDPSKEIQHEPEVVEIDEEPSNPYESPAERDARERRNAKRLAKKLAEIEKKTREAAAAAEADEEERRASEERLGACSALSGIAYIAVNKGEVKLCAFGQGMYSSAIWIINFDSESNRDLPMFSANVNPVGELSRAPSSKGLAAQISQSLMPISAEALLWLPYPGESPSISSWPCVTAIAQCSVAIENSSFVVVDDDTSANVAKSKLVCGVVVGYNDGSLHVALVGDDVVPHACLELNVLKDATTSSVMSIISIPEDGGSEGKPLFVVGASDGAVQSFRLDIGQLIAVAQWNDAGRPNIQMSKDMLLEEMNNGVVEAEKTLDACIMACQNVLKYKVGEEMDNGKIFESDGQEEVRALAAKKHLEDSTIKRDTYISKIPPRDIVGMASRRPLHAPQPLDILFNSALSAVRPVLAGAENITVSDVTEAAAFSLEESKARAGQDAALAAAADRKVVVRDQIAQLRSELVEILIKNEALSRPLPKNDLIVDLELAEESRRRSKQAVLQTERELARERERAEKMVKKLQDHFLKPLQQEDVVIRGVRHRDIAASTIRTLMLTDELTDLIATLHAKILMAETEEMRDDDFGGNPLGRGAIRGRSMALIGDENDSAAGNNNLTGVSMNATGAFGGTSTNMLVNNNNTNNTSPNSNNNLTDAERDRVNRRNLRHARRAEIEAYKMTRPSETETLEEKAEIDHERMLFGTYELKIKLNQKASNGKYMPASEMSDSMKASMEKLTADEQQRLIVILAESLFTMRDEHNASILNLREYKCQLQKILSNSFKELEHTCSLLKSSPQLPPNHLALSSDFNKTYNRSDAPLCEVSHPEFDKILIEVREHLQNMQLDLPWEFPDSRMTVSQKDIDAFQKQNFICHPRLQPLPASVAEAKNAFRTPQASKAPVLNASARRESLLHMRTCLLRTQPGAANQHDIQYVTGKSAVEFRVKLLMQKRALEHSIVSHIEQFDAACHARFIQKSKLELDLANGEARLLSMREELQMLLDMADKDLELRNRLIEYENERLEIIARMQVLNEERLRKAEQVSEWNLSEFEIRKEFEEAIADHQHLKPILEKFFDRPQPKNKKAGGKSNKNGDDDDDDNSNQSDDDNSDYDSDEQSDSEDDDDESGKDDNDEDFPEGRYPPGWDAVLNDTVTDLREKRWRKQEELLKLQSEIKSLNEQNDSEEQLEFAVTEKKAAVYKDMAAFQAAKQRRLNRVSLSIPLRISALENLIPGPNEPAELSESFDVEDGENPQTYAKGILPQNLTGDVIMDRSLIAALRDRETELKREQQMLIQKFKECKHRLREEKKKKIATEKDLEEHRFEFAELQRLRFGQEVFLELLEKGEPSSDVVQKRVQLREREAGAVHNIANAEKELNEARLLLAEATKRNTELLSAIARLGHSQLDLDSQLASQLQKVRVADTEPTDRMAAAERKRLEEVLAVQVKEIATLQGEINLFRRKGGHVFSTLTAQGSYRPAPGENF